MPTINLIGPERTKKRLPARRSRWLFKKDPQKSVVFVLVYTQPSLRVPNSALRKVALVVRLTNKLRVLRSHSR